MAGARAEGVLPDERGGGGGGAKRGVCRALDEPLEREDGAVAEQHMQRLGEMHIEIEVEAAVVVGGEVSEEVDALYRCVREALEEGTPRGAPLAHKGYDVLVGEEYVREIGVQLPHAPRRRVELRRERGGAPRLQDQLGDEPRRALRQLTPAHHPRPAGGSGRGGVGVGGVGSGGSGGGGGRRREGWGARWWLPRA